MCVIFDTEQSGLHDMHGHIGQAMIIWWGIFFRKCTNVNIDLLEEENVGTKEKRPYLCI